MTKQSPLTVELRYAEAAERLLLNACGIARTYKHSELRMEHLLLALMIDPIETQYHVLSDAGLSTFDLNTWIIDRLGLGGIPVPRECVITIGDEARAFIEAAEKIRGRLDDPVIASGHLLLALLYVPANAGDRGLLAGRGINSIDLWALTLDALGHKPTEEISGLLKQINLE